METPTLVVDTYAWVEYGEESEEGEYARKLIEGNYNLLTPAIVIGELVDRAVRKGVKDKLEDKLLPFIRNHSEIDPVDDQIAEEAGELKWEMRKSSKEVGLADAIILTVARFHDAKVLTGDPDFILGARESEAVDLRKIR